MDKPRFAVRHTRHNRNLHIVRLEMWQSGVMVRNVERRGATQALALSAARSEFRARRRAGGK